MRAFSFFLSLSLSFLPPPPDKLTPPHPPTPKKKKTAALFFLTPVNPSRYHGRSPSPRGLAPARAVPPVRTSNRGQLMVRQSRSSTRPPVSSLSGFQAHQKTLR